METDERVDNPSNAIATITTGSLIAASEAHGTSLSVPIPFQNRIVLIEDTRVAGTMHVEGIDAIAKDLTTGTDLRLERDLGNLADTWAIRVCVGEKHIGYVPADCNEILARLMDGGKLLSAKLTGKEKLGSWNKLHMEVSLDD
ncbi:MAG: HIRAN domain-containing protein [Atopobiaceae bacterium]|nr:HIRAN domain-containing protein [Atopobiaceae bacterium]